MDAYQARLPKSPGAARHATPSWSNACAAHLTAGSPLQPFQFTAEQSARFLQIVSVGAQISRHQGLYRWLTGEVQQILPHQILVAAWGDFANADISLDVTSALPGVRTTQAARCRIDDFVHKMHAEWVSAGRRPVLLDTADHAPVRACGCAVHAALCAMRSAVVHGVRDRRSGNESLYIALDTEPTGANPGVEGFKFLVDCLIAQIDVAFRRLAAFPLEGGTLRPAPWREAPRELSQREQEILGWLCRGESNVDIAAALDISPHTVKNHLQRIFRKIGVNNRTQAVAHYNDAIRASAEHA